MFLSRILAKIAISVLIILFLESVSSRGRPTGSATYTCGGFFRNMPRGMWKGGRCPKFLSRILAKIAIRSADYPIFSFRQLPSASAGPRQLPTNIHVWALVDICHVACGWGGGKVSEVSDSNFN